MPSPAEIKRGFEVVRKTLVTIDVELNRARELGEIYAYSPFSQRIEAIQRHIKRTLNFAAGKSSAYTLVTIRRTNETPRS